MTPASGLLNFRDLGCLPAESGRRTRSGVLFRSDTLQEATAADIRLLWEELGVRFVVDLRSAAESVEEGRGLLATLPLCHVNVPLSPGSDEVWSRPEPLVAYYLDLLERDASLSFAIDVVATSVVRGPVLVHCAAGKDRTGVVVALLLRAVGVREDAVVADYLVSAQNMDRVVARLRRLPSYAADFDVLPASAYACEERALHAVMREVERRHGSVRQWALDRGVSSDTLLRLDAALLEPALA